MFNILYRCPRTVARHENGPLHESRRRYLEHLSAESSESVQRCPLDAGNAKLESGLDIALDGESRRIAPAST
jgi:hypothetical protein